MRIELVPSKPEYAETYFHWRNQSCSKKFNPIDPISLAECRDRLEAEGWDLGQIWTTKSFRWFVKSGDELIGNVSLKNINQRMLSAEIAYGIDEKHHGKGFGLLSVRELIKKVFNETELRRVYALVADGNIPSQKILENLGFRKEGVLREHFLIEGAPTNEVFYGILRREWNV